MVGSRSQLVQVSFYPLLLVPAEFLPKNLSGSLRVGPDELESTIFFSVNILNDYPGYLSVSSLFD
jgi:hypothetical protein